MMRLLGVAAMCLALAGCEMDTGPGGNGGHPRPPPANACGANRLSGFIGYPVSSLPNYGPWSSVRVIRPGQMVTMDYQATRLDVRVGPRGRIQSLTCG